MSSSKTENRFLPGSSLKTTGELRPKTSLLVTDGSIRPPLHCTERLSAGVDSHSDRDSAISFPPDEARTSASQVRS